MCKYLDLDRFWLEENMLILNVDNVDYEEKIGIDFEEKMLLLNPPILDFINLP